MARQLSTQNRLRSNIIYHDTCIQYNALRGNWLPTWSDGSSEQTREQTNRWVVGECSVEPSNVQEQGQGRAAERAHSNERKRVVGQPCSGGCEPGNRVGGRIQESATSSAARPFNNGGGPAAPKGQGHSAWREYPRQPLRQHAHRTAANETQLACEPVKYTLTLAILLLPNT
jgi:hypothetical protein